MAGKIGPRQRLAANANVFLDDFMLFDVAKPITDSSNLEIEKSTLNGRAYATGGGRTVDADVIDIMLTWLVNHDREFLKAARPKRRSPARRPSRTLPTRIPNCKLWRRPSSLAQRPSGCGS